MLRVSGFLVVYTRGRTQVDGQVTTHTPLSLKTCCMYVLHIAVDSGQATEQIIAHKAPSVKFQCMCTCAEQQCGKTNGKVTIHEAHYSFNVYCERPFKICGF